MFTRVRFYVVIMVIIMRIITNASVHKIIYKEFNTDKSNFGDFMSPNFPEKYPQDVRYFYIFVAMKNQQVQLTFNHFNIEGLSHSCDKDYLDIYIEVRPDSRTINITEDLFGEPLLGRFCGHNLQFIPNIIVSKYNAIVLDFFSDTNTQQSYNQDDHMGQLGFKGSYQFRLNEFNRKFLISPDLHSCRYLILYNSSRSGYIQSPNYPGLLPSPLTCTYEFRSDNPNHRIELDFLDFNLFVQSEMCPVEYVEIFDDDSLSPNSKSIAGKLCGLKNETRFVTSRNRAFVRLVVLAGREYMKGPRNIDLYKLSLQNTGFRIKYVFSEYFVSLKKLSNNRNRIPGSECDILIQSNGQSNGVLVSAGMGNLEIRRPIVCNYYFFGIHNSQNMEVVKLDFSYFYIPSMASDNCTSASLSMYSVKFQLKDLIKRRRTVTMEPEPEKRLCNEIAVPYSIKSTNPVFSLKLRMTKTKSERPIGFKLSYQFLKDFGIMGSMVAQGECHYRYGSQLNGYKGLINSPFYSSFYPNNASCRYDLIANEDEIIRIVFKVFQTSEAVSPKLVSSHDVHLSCHQDYLSVSEIIKTDAGIIRTVSTERYCGTTVPGLLVSQQSSVGFTLVFQSDSLKNGPGFLAKYEFLQKEKVFAGRCGENVSTKSLSGLISSPNFPRRYPSDLICEWHLHSAATNIKFLLLFTSFQIEGTAKSCSNAVVRIYEGNKVNPQAELCGTDSAIPAYSSRSNLVRVRFLTDVSAKGAKGFQLIWTQLLDSRPCTGFKCIHSLHCINRSLTCNKIVNCGSYSGSDGSTLIDDSDEIIPCPVKTNHTHLYSGLGVVAIILFCVTIAVMYFIHKNKDLIKKRLKLKVNNSNDILVKRFSSPSHSLLKERPTSSASGSLRLNTRTDLYASRDGSLFTNESTMNHQRQFSFDLEDPSQNSKGKDNAEALSEFDSFYREKMQKISIV